MMITNLLLKIFKKDPFLKRRLTKTFSWLIIGSLSTFFVTWFISGKVSIGTTIGIIELPIQAVIYYFHEKIWQSLRFGQLSKFQQVALIQKHIRPTLFKKMSKVSRGDREKLNNNKAFTLWLTGLSGAGKSTLAAEIEEWIYKSKGRVYVLDGDNTRLGINSDLSFSDDDRSENIRRVAEICKLFNDAGVIVIASFISPFANDRLLAKTIIGKNDFIEIYLKASVSVCQKRDTKGLYKMALEGKIKHFTGISSPYEPPVNPDLCLNTDNASVKDCINNIKELLASKINYSFNFQSNEAVDLNG